MNRYTIQPAGSMHDKELAELSKIALPGTISLALEKSPSYFRAMQLGCEKPGVYVCIDTESQTIAGTFSMGERRRSFNGRWIWQKYLSDLRIVPSRQGSRILYYIMTFIAENELLSDGEMAEAVIFTDNTPMIRYAETSLERKRRLEITPVFHFRYHYITYTFLAKERIKQKETKTLVRVATPADLPQIKSFYEQEALRQDSVHYINWDALGTGHYAGLQIGDFTISLNQNTLLGIMGTWDQSALKRTRIVGYKKPLLWLRPLVNFMSPVLGTMPLPPAGSSLEALSIAGVCVTNDDVDVFEALLYAQLRKLGKDKPLRYLQIGLDENSPFRAVMENIRPRHITKGQIYYVTKDNSIGSTPWQTRLEVGRI